MTLTLPTSINERFHISAKNLDNLLAFDSRTKSAYKKLITPVALSCFLEIQEARLGSFHYIKKMLASGFVYGTSLAIPTFTGICGFYYLAKSAEEKGYVDLTNIILGSAGAYSADYAVGVATGIRPITALIFTVADIYRQFALRLSKEVLNSYTYQEQEAGAIIKERHDTFKKQLVEVYSGVANELVNRYDKAQNEVKKMRELKSEVSKLDSKLPIFSKIFMRLHGSTSKIVLSTAEIIEILSPVQDAVDLIDQNCMTFRKDENPQDRLYNALLMIDSTSKEFDVACLSPKVRDHINEAKQHQLGWGYTLKAHISPVLSGTATLAFIPSVVAAATYLADKTIYANAITQANKIINARTFPLDKDPMNIAVTGVAALAVFGGALAAKYSYDKYFQKWKEHTEIYNTHVEEAREELLTTYNGIAEYISSQSPDAVKGQLDQLLNKIDFVENLLYKTGVIPNPLEITAKLRQTIDTLGIVR